MNVVVHLPITDPAHAAATVHEFDQVLRSVRTAVRTSWADADSGERQPTVTAWLDVECAVGLVPVDNENAVLELRLSANPADRDQGRQS